MMWYMRDYDIERPDRDYPGYNRTFDIDDDYEVDDEDYDEEEGDYE